MELSKQLILRHLSNLPGWRTNRKIVVIESDDWGSIRMPSKRTFESLQSKGVDLTYGDSMRYNLYDSLATRDDLAALFEILSSVIDMNGNPVVFTPISLAANPDFDKIKTANFQNYYYEPFTSTLKRYNREDAFKLWQEGIRNRLFVPQFHGREHLNVQVWLKALQNKDPQTRLAFEHGFWGFRNKHSYSVSYQAAFDLYNKNEIEYQKEVITSGLKLFEDLFVYKATFFVPPNGPFNNTLEQTAVENGIKYMSASKIQHEALGHGQTKKVLHWLGQKNKFGQRYITRNCFFEPSQLGKDWVNNCLSDISIAFKWHKPAIISSHRVNYIGAIDTGNRDNGLKRLKILLQEITQRWCDVEFMTSDELGKLINK